MQVYLSFFGMQEQCHKLQTQVGLTNLDALSSDWYQGSNEDDEVAERKAVYRQQILSVLTRKEFLALTYLLQFYEWEPKYLNYPQGQVL